MNSDRIFAAIWLVLSVLAAWVATSFTAEFSYEPVGPRAFPIILCALMAACSVWLLVFPGSDTAWPVRATAVRLVVMVAALLAYAVAFQSLGFPLSTMLLTIVLGRLFGGNWPASIASGVALGIGLFYAFDRLLEVTLPAGTLLEGLL